MAIISMTHFKHGNREAFMAAAKPAQQLFEASGGGFEVGQTYSGGNVGEWVAIIRFPDWDAYGKAMKRLSGDPAYNKMMMELGATNPATDRTFIVGFEP